ncbi:MAG: hypothetical protein A2077_02000 [Nitrospirae bacterium GWC2_46_6]|nr:MAG: hypothetical protein A2077_02000 [Nitrospirae bacterium GWC2_46_6]OGW21878.1 MAG: hypothetical protein A2Z82_09725 [Nitrospirae bacterium GWA2_46_11]OGW25145.1 MAG: hypothetical protein A2X55_11710 [Nitrospirae bacterium GWB2_47_37]HAK89576.1 hypothetical protein [Nitrospiraceae bacterium]HCZ12051.1 hypothetical protein [Nitrospiraceae bacterium]
MDLQNAPHTEEYEEELKTALVCESNPESQKNIASIIQELKYSVELSANQGDTLEKLRFNRYDVIVLNEKFDANSPEENNVYNILKFMPMSTRRHIFLALIGQNFQTGDHGAAFAESVNLVVNEKDLPNLKTVLKKSIADNDQFYKVYKESLIKMGKR